MKQTNADFIPAKPVSHWMWTTFRDIITGDIVKRAELLHTTPLRAVNAQTIAALFNRDWITIHKDENLVPTELGLQVWDFFNTHEGRYRLRDYGITDYVQGLASRATRSQARAARVTRMKKAS